MKHQSITTILAVGLIASLGAGCTEDGGLRSGGLGPPDSPAAAFERSERLESPTSAIIGKEVVDMQGRRVGEVDAVASDQVIVTTGGFLGLGARRVALDSRQLATIGSGANLRLRTSLTQSQLEALPEVRDERREGGLFGR